MLLRRAPTAASSMPKKPFVAIEPKGPAVYFPKYTVTLLLSAPHHRKNQASFRVPSHITKFDLYQYLTKIYGLNILKISTYNFIPKYYKENGVDTRTRAWKKAIVDLDHEFEFPSMPSSKPSLKEDESKNKNAEKEEKQGQSFIQQEKKLTKKDLIQRPHRPAFKLRKRRGLRSLLAAMQTAKIRKIPRKRSKSKYATKPLVQQPPSIAIPSSKLKRSLTKKIKRKDRRMMPRIIVDSIRDVPKEHF